MFLHLSVSHSVHRGVSAPVHAGIHPWTRADPSGGPPGTRGKPPPGADPPVQCMLEDTGNKRAVRILLECILVSKRNSSQLVEIS